MSASPMGLISEWILERYMEFHESWCFGGFFLAGARQIISKNMESAKVWEDICKVFKLRCEGSVIGKEIRTDFKCHTTNMGGIWNSKKVY